MGDYQATTIESIKLDAKLGRQSVQERLSLDVRVESCSLRAFPCLRAADVVAILIVNIDTIELLIAYYSY